MTDYRRGFISTTDALMQNMHAVYYLQLERVRQLSARRAAMNGCIQQQVPEVAASCVMLTAFRVVQVAFLRIDFTQFM